MDSAIKKKEEIVVDITISNVPEIRIPSSCPEALRLFIRTRRVLFSRFKSFSSRMRAILYGGPNQISQFLNPVINIFFNILKTKTSETNFDILAANTEIDGSLALHSFSEGRGHGVLIVGKLVLQ